MPTPQKHASDKGTVRALLLMVVGSGWRLALGRSWRLAAVGGWRLVAVGGGWCLAVDGPLGRSLRAVLNKKKTRSQRSALALHDSAGGQVCYGML